MGLLDGNLDDPQKQMLMALAAGLLAPQGGKNFGANVGSAIPQGLLAYNQAKTQQAKLAEEAQQKQLRDLQIQQAQKGMETQGLLDTIAKRHLVPGMPQMQPTDYETPSGPAGPSSFNFQGYMNDLPSAGAAGVEKALALRQSMAKEPLFSKVEANAYTPESIAAFQRTEAMGRPDYSILRPRTKVELAGNVAYDPMNTKPGSVVIGPTSDVVPDGKGGWTFNPAKINPLERQRVAIEGGRYQYETGNAPPGMFVTPSIPRQAGAAPVTPPAGAPVGQTVPGLSPKQQREVAAENAKALPDDLKSYQDTRANLDLMIDQAKQIQMHPGLAGATGSLGAFPNMPGGNAANATAIIDSFKAKTAFNALQAMRNASKTGGALGSVSDQEGKRLENSLAALDRAQSTKQYRSELGKTIAYAENAKKRLELSMRQRYGEDVFKAPQQADPLGIR